MTTTDPLEPATTPDWQREWEERKAQRQRERELRDLERWWNLPQPDCEMRGCRHEQLCPRPAEWWIEWTCVQEGTGALKRFCTEHKDEAVRDGQAYHCCGGAVVLDGWGRL